jgi:hypothetical protein
MTDSQAAGLTESHSAEEIEPIEEPLYRYLLPDAKRAYRTSPFFKLVRGNRLRAIGELRHEMADIIQQNLPQTTGDLYRLVEPPIIRYAEDLFGHLAEVKLKNGCQPRAYEKWLDRCTKAVVSDCCEGMSSQFPTAVGLLAHRIDERQSPETFRAVWGLWEAWNPFSSKPFSENLESCLKVQLMTQTRLLWLAKAHRAPHTGNRAQKRSSGAARPQNDESVNIDKGNLEVLGDKDRFTNETAQRFLGLGKRAVEKAIKRGDLEYVGRGLNKRITRKSLLLFLPPKEKTN